MRTKLLNIRISILSAILLLFVCRVQADTIWTEGHHEIYDGNTGNTYREMEMYNDCTLDIFGGIIGRLAVYDTTVTNWYDGQMSALWTRENSIVNIYGGQLGGLSAIDDSLVNLFAYDIVFEPSGGYDDGWLYGKFYSNNSSFAIHLGTNAYGHINIVPEPTTFMLLTLGGFLLRKKNK